MYIILRLCYKLVTSKTSYLCQNIFDGATIKVRQPLDYRTVASDLRTFEQQTHRHWNKERFISDLRNFELQNFRNEEPISGLRTFGLQNLLFRAHEPSDYRTFGMKNLLLRTYEPSGYRTFRMKNFYFGLQNFLFQIYEPSDLRTFGIESNHHNYVARGSTNSWKVSSNCLWDQAALLRL